MVYSNARKVLWDENINLNKFDFFFVFLVDYMRYFVKVLRVDIYIMKFI